MKLNEKELDSYTQVAGRDKRPSKIGIDDEY